MYPHSLPAHHMGASFDLPEGIDQVVTLVSTEFGISKRLILNVSRCRANASKARQLAMYLSHVVLGETLTAVGSAFGRDRTTVSYACGLVEDMRDDPQLDRELDRLEALLVNREATDA